MKKISIFSLSSLDRKLCKSKLTELLHGKYYKFDAPLLYYGYKSKNKGMRSPAALTFSCFYITVSLSLSITHDMYNFVVLKMLTISFFEIIHMIYLARLTRFDIFPYCVHFRRIKPLKKTIQKNTSRTLKLWDKVTILLKIWQMLQLFFHIIICTRRNVEKIEIDRMGI